jgi:trk system potassium uptake protein TrkH
MRMRFILAFSAHVVFFVGIAMAIPLAISIAMGEADAAPIAWAMAFSCGLSGLVWLTIRVPKEDLTRREGMMIATLAWLLAGIFGALPYFFAGIFGPMGAENFLNCLFESLSGFTTTGSSVLGATVPIESLGKGILFWRSLTHWLGGMGIIVLAIAILPLLGVGGMELFRAEAAGHLQEKLRPRIRETALTLWVIYVIITAVSTVLLLTGGMDLFDALCHSFAAIASGGFSTHDASIAAFHSRFIEIVLMGVMFAGTVNFSLHYIAWTKRPIAYLRDEQFRYYAAFLVGGIIFVSASLYFAGTYASPGGALRYGSFQAVSIMTTTGFSTADYNGWPAAPQLALLLFMIMGGCAGSTAGALKTMRVVLLFKYAYREIVRLVHPKVFAAVKMDGRVVHKNILESVAAFFVFYMLTFIAAVLIVASSGMRLDESLYGVAATMGGVGPAIGSIGSMGNYFAVPVVAKVVFMACMLIGRLEIFTVFVLLAPIFWRK